MGLVAPSEPAIAGELEVEIVSIVLRDGNRGLDLLLGTGMRGGDLRANGVGGLEAVARQQELDDHGHRKPVYATMSIPLSRARVVTLNGVPP